MRILKVAGHPQYCAGCRTEEANRKRYDAAVALMVKSERSQDEDAYRAQVYAREEERAPQESERNCDSARKM